MSKNACLEVKDGKSLENLKDFLKALLEKNLVDALLIPQEVPSGENVFQTLVTDTDHLEEANALAPVMPVNSAKLVAHLTVINPGKKIGAVLRSCEIRALIELVKLKQATLDNLLIMGIDCLGTYSVTDYASFVQTTDGKYSPTGVVLAAAEEAKEISANGYHPRSACQICEFPTPQTSDLVIGLIGVDPKKEILLQAQTPAGEEILSKLGLEETREANKREEILTTLVEERKKKKNQVFEETEKEVLDIPSLLAVFSKCIRCYNCKTACPICYCKECLFETPTFNYTPEKYLRMAKRKGAIKMPTDTLLFHLTRMNHMITSCVGCGQCESACPSNIPLLKIFRTLGDKVQKIFDYVPGRKIEEELPLATFKEDELKEIGGE
ncbi:MAG: Coenzyme F420 hydrogenase/dehydrogenase, beta subunit C-terminal domain [bacterium]